MKNILLAILLSISPISELRGGIVYLFTSMGLEQLMGLGFLEIALLSTICVIANILVIIPIWFFMDFLHHRLVNIKIYKKTADFFLIRMHKKSKELEPKINNYGYIALALFTAIPLPVTGAWTASIIAWILGLSRKKSFFAIALGVILAGIIVTLLTLASLGLMELAFS